MRKEQEGFEACKMYWSLAGSVEYTFVTLLSVIQILKMHSIYWVLCHHRDYQLLSVEVSANRTFQTLNVS